MIIKMFQYDMMREDYLTWDGQYIWLKAKIILGNRYWFFADNFTKAEMEEVNEMRKAWTLSNKKPDGK
jgi:hypothetical protein